MKWNFTCFHFVLREGLCFQRDLDQGITHGIKINVSRKENSTVHQAMKKTKKLNCIFSPYSIHMIINQKLISVKSELSKVNSKLV